MDTAAAKYQTKRQVCGAGTVTPKVRGKAGAHGYEVGLKGKPHRGHGGSHFSPDLSSSATRYARVRGPPDSRKEKLQSQGSRQKTIHREAS